MKESDGARAPGQEYRWALPSVLLGDGEEGRPVKRSTRDWIVDTVMFMLACGLTLLTLPDISGDPEPLQATEQVIGALACASVWLRRRWPVTLALVLNVLSTGLVLVGGASAVALFTVAVHRPFKISGPVAVAGMITLFPLAYFRPSPDLGFWGNFTLGASIVTALFAWGLVVRARRQLVWSLRAQADTAAEQARHLERERIAREMHDVLAHRLSILSLHAGALEFHPDAGPAEISRAAGAIRESAHQALQDLRGVIGVLRHGGDDAVPERPQPTLADLSGLVAECRQAGMDVALILPDHDGVPDALGRNAYRIVQEALTNARKHAAGAPVTVRVSGGPGDGLTVEVRNPTGVRLGSPIPGAGAGLIGLTERAELSGGRLEHGPRSDGDFLVKAWLPWTT
ncbi:sensor histidine kinase [Nonomuraea sp. NPDC050790]|uniref:sensor histidine kinase n=1 Tax=Nonomuraea sp. NPDC050790 TaxID=3364371 RepID=UPI0037A60F54